MSAVKMARTLVAGLVHAGVREVVLSPGSRSGGIALALSGAHQRGEVRLHVVLDERGAGFLALGLAKASGGTVAVVTTSGTAVANLAPAVAEARHSGARLLVVSADRPVSLHDAGTNQTTRQVGLFGDLPLETFRVSSESGAPADWWWTLQRAVVVASGVRTRQPGPVHLNVEMAEPLVDAGLLQPLPRLPRSVVAESRPGIPLPMSPDRRTVVLVGDTTPASGQHARAIAERGELPLLAEPSSNARAGRCAVPGYGAVLDGPLGARIERVLLVGHPTLSRPVSRLLSRDDVEVVAITTEALPATPGKRARTVVDDVELEPGDPEWLALWREAGNAVEVERWSAGAVAREVWAACPGQPLVVGSSASIRHLDLAPVSDNPPVVWANRGLAGIDGTLHTAAGVALAHSALTTVLLGDLTFLHDLTGLVVGELEERAPLRIVVVDDHGGSIFHQLEQGDAEFAAHFERVFATPQRVDVLEVARGLGHPAERVSSLDELRAALAAETTVTRVVVASVPRGR